MEDIRVAVMQRLVSKRQEMEKQTSMLCPRIQVMLEKEKVKAVYCDVLPSAENIFNVRHNLDQLNVDLDRRTCTCRKWDTMEEFVDEFFKREVYLRAYAGSIPPCEGERHWPRVECKLDPPPIKVGPGRPRKNRIKDPFEQPKKQGTLSRHGMEMTCSICMVKGHNKRKCPNKESAVLPQPKPKKPRGRPRKETSEPVTNAAGTTAPPTSVGHYSTTAQPTELGRGGRMVLGGRGAKSGGTGRGK
ncbi:Structure-specific endonuclease subunit slx4, partial [Bienertia sinuspersici]